MFVFGCNATPRDDGIALTTTGESTGGAPASTSGDASTAMPPDSATSTDAVDETGTSTGGEMMECTCAPGTDLVHVLSDAGELWSYDPATNAFALVGTPPCGGYQPFSMAVDREGMAWLLLLDDVAFSVVVKGMFKVPITDASTCDAVPYEDGIFGAFGTSFVSNPPPDTCEKLYVQSYSGDGP